MCVSYRVFRWATGHSEEDRLPLLREIFPLAPGEVAESNEGLLSIWSTCSGPLTGPDEDSEWFKRSTSQATGYAPGQGDVLGQCGSCTASCEAGASQCCEECVEGVGRHSSYCVVARRNRHFVLGDSGTTTLTYQDSRLPPVVYEPAGRTIPIPQQTGEVGGGPAECGQCGATRERARVVTFEMPPGFDRGAIERITLCWDCWGDLFSNLDAPMTERGGDYR